jgi:hypothetical protein
MTQPPESPAAPRSKRKPVRRNPHQTGVRWNDDDYARLLANAEKAGMSVSAYIRFCALEKPVTPSRRQATVELQALAKAIGLVNKLGGNVYQLVRFMNFHGIVYPQEVVAALEGLDILIIAMMGAIGRRP